jgi:hypothetical protein
MRPAVSPVNAAVYGVEESGLAPVEDLALSFEDFAALCGEGVLKPHAHHLTIKPHVRLWSDGSASDRSRASGHVEIEGFLPASVLRLAGYRTQSEGPLSEEEQKKKVLELMETSLVGFLRKTFPSCQATFSPATVLRSPGQTASSQVTAAS